MKNARVKHQAGGTASRIGDAKRRVASSSTASSANRAESDAWIDELLLACSTEAIARHDASGRILWVSPNAHVVFGRPRAALLHSDLRELVAEPVPASYRKALERSFDDIATAGHSRCTYRLAAEGGSERWVETFFRGIFDRQGGLLEIHSLTRDIDRLKRPLEEVAARERQWRAALDLMPVVIMQVDSNLQVVATNHCATELFSQPLDRLLQRDAVSLLCTEGSFEETKLRQLTKKLSYVEAEIYSAPLERWLSVAFYPVPAAGRLEAGLLRLLDITPRKRAEEKLQRSVAGLRQVAARLQSVREEERARISREIHDQLGHQLTGLSLTLGWLRGRLQADHQKGMVDRVDGMLTLLDGTMQSVRKITTDLRPAVLDHLGLAAAIRWQCSEFRQRTQVEVAVDLESSTWSVAPPVSTALFRILQEALTNVTRHAGANRVSVSVRSWESQLLMSVEDDGKGLDLGALSDHTCGLFGMEQRALELGGQFWVESEPGRGTKVTVRVPLQGLALPAL
jgi:PAS domain S-box-containing protein